MEADTTSRTAPATRSHGCRQSPSLTLRCLPTALCRNGNTPAPGGSGTARQAIAAVALDPIMAAQRPSFPACPWSVCPTLPKEALMRRLSRTSTPGGRMRIGLMEIVSFPETATPGGLRAQVLTLQRQAWPGAAPGYDPALRPLSMLLVDDGVVLAALDILFKEIVHAGRRWGAAGLSTVVTGRGGRGHGSRTGLGAAARDPKMLT